MAMSGTPTASTAGVSVLGGLTHILKLGERLQPQVQELQQAQWPVLCPAGLGQNQLWFSGGQLS